jgi:O-acetylserine/cysteine efflux transporter
MIVRSIATLVVLAVVWGGSIPVIKLGLRDVPPLTLTALRYLVAAPCFVWLLARAGALPPPRVIGAAAALGVLGIGLGQVAQTLGVGLTPASVATVVSSLIPVFVVVLAALRLRQPVGAVQAVGLGAAFAGVALVAGGDPRGVLAAFGAAAAHGAATAAAPPAAAASPGGIGLVFLSAAAVALYYVLSVELIAHYSVLTVAALSSLAGAAALVPVAAWELGHASLRVTPVSVGAVLYLGLLVTVAGLLVWFRALLTLPARIPAALQYLQPVVGVLASAWLFGDRLDLWFWTGTGLVLAGIGLSAGGRARPSAAPAAPAPVAHARQAGINESSSA